MKNAYEAALMRRDLDPILRKWRRLAKTTPNRVWIRDIREALGLTCAELAAKMGISTTSLSCLQFSEEEDKIELRNLRRAARALGCSLVYALVPHYSLEKTVAARRSLAVMKANEALTRIDNEKKRATTKAAGKAMAKTENAAKERQGSADALDKALGALSKEEKDAMVKMAQDILAESAGKKEERKPSAPVKTYSSWEPFPKERPRYDKE
jgi:predicted DNA-binding mobile mystery protein A